MKRFSIVAFALASLLIAGCAPAVSPPGPGPTPSTGTTSSTLPTAPPSTPVTTAPLPAPVTVRVYFDLSEKMQPVLRTAPAGTKATLKAALTALLAGPGPSEAAAGLHTLIPAGTTLRGVSISGKTATVDLSASFSSGGGTLSMTNRLAQVVFTATQFPSVTAVKFKVGGKAVSVFGGEGILLDHPQKRTDYEGATPPIFMDSPAWLGTVRSGATAHGTANVFEGTFRLQLRDAMGVLIVDKTVHAASGTGTRGTWSQKLTWSTAKAGLGELKLFAASPKDGRPIDVLTVPVTIVE